MSTAPLDADRLVADAEAATGLDDWGLHRPYWYEALGILVDSLNADAHLHDTGRMIMEARLGVALACRLQVIDWRARHPETADERIDQPVIITGLPRTGTTALSNLLAQDPYTRSLRVWESAHPVPPPEAEHYDDDPRIAETQAGIDMFDAMVPAMRSMHHDTATSTAESLDLLGMSLRTQHYVGMAEVATYDRWWHHCDMGPAYAFHRDVLQVLQSRCPPTRWHLKNPPDLFFLDAVATTYPDVRFIWTHRDPAAVLPSVASLIATVRSAASDHIDPVAIGHRQLEVWALAAERGLAWRAAHPDRFVDVHMADLVADPVAEIGALYDGLGWDLTIEAENAIADWSAAHPQGEHGEHRPDPADYGLEPAEVRYRFLDYLATFGLEER